MLTTERQLVLAKWLMSNKPAFNTTSITINEIIENGVGSLAVKAFKKESNNQDTNTLEQLETLEKLDQNLKVIHALQFQQFRKIFTMLDNANIPFVVLKGWALSYSVYPQSHHRPKTDIDVLINHKDKNAVKHLFEKEQYINPRGWEPTSIIDQFTLRKPLVKGIYASADIHLELSDDKLIQHQFKWANIYNESLRNEILGANTPSIPMMIIHAAIHLLNHYVHGDMIKLIWLYDIKLLLHRATTNDTYRLKEHLINSGLAKPVSRVFENVALAFPSSKVTNICDLLKPLPSSPQFEYLLKDPSLIKSYFRKLKHTSGIRNKVQVVIETLFPPKQEIFRKYGYCETYKLPIFYVIRIVNGLITRVFK